ncbi:hypothetical protein F511_19502 [Dorcoceras hygrometricum]|uniref:Uncharacterized protein n=1 Tax=Dorcoceras hygrometricum TaxID=472368 RepID=A0A2Z7CQT7_9LAMI|nr:hypothetical protein F511_19502 [Dorcoceras hygrometricum]
MTRTVSRQLSPEHKNEHISAFGLKFHRLDKIVPFKKFCIKYGLVDNGWYRNRCFDITNIAKFPSRCIVHQRVLLSEKPAGNQQVLLSEKPARNQQAIDYKMSGRGRGRFEERRGSTIEEVSSGGPACVIVVIIPPVEQLVRQSSQESGHSSGQGPSHGNSQKVFRHKQKRQASQFRKLKSPKQPKTGARGGVCGELLLRPAALVFCSKGK